MAWNVAGVTTELEFEDFYLLSGIEQGTCFSEWANREKSPKNSGLTVEEVDYRIDRCMIRELVEYKTIQHMEYKLTVEGYDALAPRTFAQRDTIQGFGAPLGVGKESDVFEVQPFKPLVLKFHREGCTDFRGVYRECGYASKNHRISWLYAARRAAKREYKALEIPFPEMSVPRPADYSRHAIIMAKFDGVELAKAKLESGQVTGILDLILSEMADAYTVGYAHADMSEYNVAVGERSVTVFNQPQTIPTDHDNARRLLARDVKSIIGYFRHKYLGETLNEVDIDALSDAIVGNEFENVDEFVV